MTSLYVIGGQQRNIRSMLEREATWYKYRKGMILRVDPDSGYAQSCLEYVSPPEVCAVDGPAILFKCATLQDDMIYASTQTEVMAYSVPDFTLRSYLSLPCFNDVHHVRPTPEGNLLVAISGLDMVAEVTWDGEILREWNTLGEYPWSKFSREVDYRRIASTKPHLSHPNQVFYVGEEIWVTRFEQRDAICLTNPGRRVNVGTERVHDGVVHDGYIYFTAVNGCITIVNAGTLVVEDVIDLNIISSADAELGWCRGIMLDGDKAWVGFSSFRRTKLKQNVAWVRKGFRKRQDTRIACYDLANKRLITEINLQCHGLDGVFSIFPAPDESAAPMPAHVYASDPDSLSAGG